MQIEIRPTLNKADEWEPDLKTHNKIESQPTLRVSKKNQIISLRASGVGGIEVIATITGARPSYVGLYSRLRDF